MCAGQTFPYVTSPEEEQALYELEKQEAFESFVEEYNGEGV